MTQPGVDGVIWREEGDQTAARRQVAGDEHGAEANGPITGAPERLQPTGEPGQDGRDQGQLPKT